jgi:hypothetical protein
MLSLVIIFNAGSKNKRLEQDVRTIISEKDTLFKKTGDEKQRLLAFNFDAFKDLASQDPLPFLKKLATSLTKDTYLTKFSWDATPYNNHWSYAFEATIMMPETANAAKHKRKGNRTVYANQQKIQKRIQKHYPDTTVIWLPSPDKTAYILGVSWDK